jgi:hypothetical protein
MKDDGYNSQNRLLQQIAREERLIQECEHELQELRALSKSQPLENDLIDDSLEAFLKSRPNIDISSSLLQSLTTDAPHKIQYAIRSFCFTNTIRQSRNVYLLKGYFMANISVKGTIQVEIQHADDANTIKVKCSLDREEDAWMGQRVSDDNLPFWIEGISSYLQFDKKRAQFLAENDFAFEQREYRVRIRLAEFLTVYWDWQWKRGEDTLRLPASTPPSTIIQPRNLEALLLVCKGNCIDALKLLRETLASTHVDHANNSSGEDSSESDSEPTSSRKAKLKSPSVKKQVKERKRNRTFVNEVESGDESSGGGSVPISPVETRQRIPPTQSQVKKRRRKSGYLDIVMAKRNKR